MRKKSQITCEGFLLAMLFFCSCSPKTVEQIQIGVTPFPGYAYFYLAKEKGYLDQNGYHFKLVNFPSLADSRRAFERGQLDVVAGTSIELLNIRAMTPSEAQAFFVIDSSIGADVLLAQKNIPDITSLRGKRVAYEAQTVDMMMVYQALQSAGMTFKDIIPVPMAQLEMVDAFQKGSIDAAQTYPPGSNLILDSGKAHPLFDSSKVPLTVIDILIAEPSWLRTHAGAVKILLQAFYQAQEFAKNYPEEAKQIILQSIQIRPSDYEHLFEGLTFPKFSDQNNLLRPEGAVQKNLELSSQIFVSQGLLPNIDSQVQWTFPYSADPEQAHAS